MMKRQRTNATSIMASFATLKSLTDAKKYQNSYQILREFISYIILTDSLYIFSTIEMKNLLKKHFCFQIPEAVIKTALKKMPGITYIDGVYKVSTNELRMDKLFEHIKKESDEYELQIIRMLSEYISNKTGNNAIDEEILTQELANFLLEDISSNSNRHSDIIGEFVLKNENNKDIQDGLNKIREGSILYIGLNHNINEIGSIKKPLTLYLGTEILFSFAGYNGEVFQQLANDFFEQVSAANVGKEKKVILHYFSEIKNEIDEFFDTASEIVEGKRQCLVDRVAMKAITDGCQTAADVDVKKADFYYKLRYGFGITEDPHDDYYEKEFFSINLESLDYVDEADKQKKKEMAIKLVSHINKRRNGECFQSDIDSEHIIVTNAKITLLISQKMLEDVKISKGIDNICNFAITLDRITSLLWYKLGNGFSKNKFPINVNVALKARIVLSASIARNAEREFTKIKKEYSEGQITDDQVAARIIMLRNKPILPEDLQGACIDETTNFTPEFLSRFEERVRLDQQSLEEKNAIITTIKADSATKDKTIAEQQKIISSPKEILSERDNIIANQEKKIGSQEHELEGYRKKEYMKKATERI